ncbi:ARD/ARD' family protein [Acanthocheilonema viteae]
MVQIWYMEPYPCGDPRLPHHLFPPKKITPDELIKRTGTLYFKIIFKFLFLILIIFAVTHQVSMSKRIALLKKGRKLTKEDVYTLNARITVDFEDKIEELFEETELSSEIAILIIEGSAYYDVEDNCGNWLRILCEYGDLLIIPAGKLYRFTTTTENFVKMRRFFKADKH